MPFEFFENRFPELAQKETRRIVLCGGANVGLVGDDLPSGDYHLIEMFCNDPGCDCRRVMFYVVDPDTSLKPLAIIAYGWESDEFYANWTSFNDPNMVAELKGPVLNLGSPQSRYAEEILDLVGTIALRDANYIERVRRHYRMFRDTVDQETAGRGKVDRNRVDRQSAAFQQERKRRKREFAARKRRRKKKRA